MSFNIGLHRIRFKKVLLFSRTKDYYYRTATLKIGKHDYFGLQLTLLPVRTMHRGLCYKLEPLSDQSLPLYLIVTSSSKNEDKLKKIHLFVASNNTWQGTIIVRWPYSKVPPLVTGEFDTESYKIITVDLKENQWNYRTGVSDFDDCMNEYNSSKCSSIFDPALCEYQNK